MDGRLAFEALPNRVRWCWNQVGSALLEGCVFTFYIPLAEGRFLLPFFQSRSLSGCRTIHRFLKWHKKLLTGKKDPSTGFWDTWTCCLGPEALQIIWGDRQRVCPNPPSLREANTSPNSKYFPWNGAAVWKAVIAKSDSCEVPWSLCWRRTKSVQLKIIPWEVAKYWVRISTPHLQPSRRTLSSGIQS